MNSLVVSLKSLLKSYSDSISEKTILTQSNTIVIIFTAFVDDLSQVRIHDTLTFSLQYLLPFLGRKYLKFSLLFYNVITCPYCYFHYHYYIICISIVAIINNITCIIIRCTVAVVVFIIILFYHCCSCCSCYYYCYYCYNYY